MYGIFIVEMADRIIWGGRRRERIEIEWISIARLCALARNIFKIYVRKQMKLDGEREN